MKITIQEFADLIYEHRKIAFARIARKGYPCLNLDVECATRVIPGKKYTKVDVGPQTNWSGKFMIDVEGNIFGIKAYGVIHKGHHYGTLETTHEWFWGDYHPRKL